MPEVLGPLSIVNHALPTGVDGVKVAQWRLRDGLTFQEFVGNVALALGQTNEELMRNWGFIMALTEEDHLEYPDGASVTELQEITDMDRVDMVHGTTLGHMIEMKAYGGAVGGSWRYFRDSRQAQIVSTIRTIRNRAIWRFEKRLLNRFFTNTENAVGSAGYDVPFVRGTGGTVDYTPPAYAGQSFTTAHDHFLGVDADSKDHDDMLNELAETLEEHGHAAPFTAIVSRVDVTSYAAQTNFVKFVSPLVTVIDRGGMSTGGTMYASGQPAIAAGVFGHYETEYGLVELRASSRVPTGYAGMFKSYGMNDPRNPLAVRVHPSQGFGLFIAPELSDREDYPVKRINIEFEFGVSVGEDRTNGAVGYLVSGGTFANPTIS